MTITVHAMQISLKMTWSQLGIQPVLYLEVEDSNVRRILERGLAYAQVIDKSTWPD